MFSASIQDTMHSGYTIFFQENIEGKIYLVKTDLPTLCNNLFTRLFLTRMLGLRSIHLCNLTLADCDNTPKIIHYIHTYHNLSHQTRLHSHQFHHTLKNCPHIVYSGIGFDLAGRLQYLRVQHKKGNISKTADRNQLFQKLIACRESKHVGTKL